MTLRTLLYAVLVLSLTGCVVYGGRGHYSPGYSGPRYDHDRWGHDYRRDDGRSVIIYQPSDDRRYYSRDRYVPRPDSRDGHRDDRHHGASRDHGRDRDRRSQGNSHSVVPRHPRQEQAEHNRQGQRQPGYNRQDPRQQQGDRQQVRRQDADRRDRRDSPRYSR